MKEKIFHVTISTALILISFFLGMNFEQKYLSQEVEKILTEQYRVDLSLTGNTLKIQKNSKNISIFLNNEFVTSETKTLPK